MEPRANYNLLFAFLCILFLAVPLAAQTDNESGPDMPATIVTPEKPFAITLFIPTAEQIHSVRIFDQINGPERGSVLFATGFGLSTYNGTWSTRHINRNNVSEGLLDDFVTAIEYDAEGNLWIGYPAGIQIYNGRTYTTIRDQQHLKDMRIMDLQRWNNDMWVATGSSGIHRVRNGTWTWFQPMTQNGPPFFEINSMKIDPVNNMMIIGTENEGNWVIRSHEDPVRFDEISPPGGSFSFMPNVRRDPTGGAFFFNDTDVAHYTPATGFVHVLNRRDLTYAEIEINDIAPSRSGTLYLGTDDGIYAWKDNAVYRHISRYEGIGTATSVRFVCMDINNRLWFATTDDVGYYIDLWEPHTTITVVMATPTKPVDSPAPDIVTATGLPPETPAKAAGEVPASGSLFDPVFRIINAITGIFGFTLFPVPA